MLKRFFTVVFCTLIVLTLAVSPVSAKPFSFSLPFFDDNFTAEQTALIEDLRSKYVPEIENILFPEQRETFRQSIQEGYSLRKAFRRIALTLEQKGELASMMKTIPMGELFAALTPEQKKEVFMNKKDMFIPTPEDIAEKIKMGMESKSTYAPEDADSVSASPEEIAEKIKLGFDKKKEFMPSMEDIKAEISTLVN